MVSKGEMWVLTRTASRSDIVKSGQAHIGLITASRSPFWVENYTFLCLLKKLACVILYSWPTNENRNLGPFLNLSAKKFKSEFGSFF